VFIALVYLVGPRERFGSSNTYTRPAPTHADLEPLLPPIVTTRPDSNTVTGPDSGSGTNKGSGNNDAPATTPKTFPSSPETDPDPLKTVHCSTKHASAKNIVQYALMIDAGSTGSRIHIYKFNNCGPSPTYEYEVFKMTKPGLSYFANEPEEAAKSLDTLLDAAVKVVPPSLHKCTPVAVKATAGLRLTGAEQSKAILAAVRSRLEKVYPFEVYHKDGVVIMDGAEEGVYAWITANYLLNTIRADSPKDTPTYAVLDLGGASTQIVFEPAFTKPDETLIDGEHKYDLDFGGKKRVLYQHSYLGYGLMRARAHVHQLVDFMSSIRPHGEKGIVANPCLARGTQRTVEVTDPRVGTKSNVTMKGEDVGSFEACNRIVELVMAKDAVCTTKPCSFDGVYQPSLLDTFTHGKVLLLSYFYDRISPLLPTTTSSAPKLSISTVADLATKICLGKSSWKKYWGQDKELMADISGRPEYCLDLTFMHALLRLGYEFDADKQVQMGKKVENTELGWCLGATIAMVGGDLKCRV
jgi:guanosine-diphosphatase